MCQTCHTGSGAHAHWRKGQGIAGRPNSCQRWPAAAERWKDVLLPRPRGSATAVKGSSAVPLVASVSFFRYSDLVAAVDISNVRELEDLIIECFYAGLVRGNLDQRKQQLEVSFSFGRDVRTEQVRCGDGRVVGWVEEQAMRWVCPSP